MFKFKYGELYLDGDKVSLYVSPKGVSVKLGNGYVGTSMAKSIVAEMLKNYRTLKLGEDMYLLEFKGVTVLSIKNRLYNPTTDKIWKNVKEDELPEL